MPDFLANLAVVLGVAALTTMVFQRLRQPVVLGYLLAGLIVGPHLPVPLVADEKLIHTLSELGVILLMFALGLEFSLRKLVRVAPTAGLVALIECSVMVWLGYLVGRAFGWTGFESAFVGALIAISSTTILVKAFAELGIKGRLTEIVFGIVIVEDLIAVLLLAILTAAASGAGLSAWALVKTIGRLAGFLVAFVGGGLMVVPRLMRAVVKLERSETTVVASVGICFVLALLARSMGYSVAMGAFLAGALVSESGEGAKIQHLVEPVRDVFAAIFFVSVGMLIEPRQIYEHAGAVLVLTGVVLVGKLLGVSVGSFLAGNGIKTSLQAGLSLAQIGEFSFIIVGVGTSLGVVRGFLYPVAVAVSALTTLTAPWLIRAAGPVAAAVDRRLPRALQTYAALYGAWVDELRRAPAIASVGARVRRGVLWLVVDVAAVGAIVAGASLGSRRAIGVAAAWHAVGPGVAKVAIVVAAGALTLPFVIGAVRTSRALAVLLARQALPLGAGEGGLDLGAAPRRALVVGLQLTILLGAGTPVVALTQPFLPSLAGPLLLAPLLLALGVLIWQSAGNLHGHVRAGVQVITEAMAAEARSVPSGAEADTESAKASDAAARILPGIGAPRALTLKEGALAVGRTLKTLHLRGLTGATVLAIDRGADGGIVVPTGDEALHAGDTLIITGSGEATQAAIDLLS
ncbi:MAG TPA: cation:proton antiporter [Polyangia bacterium]